MSNITKLKSVEEVGENKRVILRMDLDLPIVNGEIMDNNRLKKSIPTIRLLLEHKNKIAIIGHRGRPSGTEAGLSLKPVYLELMSILEAEGENIIENVFVDDFSDEETIKSAWQNNQILFFENTRFFDGEKENNPDYLMTLVGQSELFVNDALAVAHRAEASMTLHKILPTYYGLDFVEEVEKMSRLKNEPDRPVTLLLGGAKEDKLKYLPELTEWAEKVLIGGKLPEFSSEILKLIQDDNRVVIGKLKENKLDIDEETIKKFEAIIAESRTVVWAGAMGKYEEDGNRNGTDKMAMAITGSAGKKVVAGGDTTASIKNMGLTDKIDFFVAGGGVLLEFLTKENLPAWE